jgi:hypothetical protein
MIFESRYEAFRWFRKYSPYEGDVKDEIPEGLKFGDFVLFRHIDGDGDGKTPTISRPIFGIFVGFSVWDMALVFQFVEKERAWEFSHKVITNKELKIKLHVGALDREVEYIPLWNQSVKIIGQWKSKPTISQLKESLLKEEKYGM